MGTRLRPAELAGAAELAAKDVRADGYRRALAAELTRRALALAAESARGSA